MHQVAVLVGSLRRDSINRKLAKAMEKLGADRFAFQYPDLDLPLYNEDLWADPPAGVTALKAAIEAADAVLFVAPEYNRGPSPVIKNAIDWASRPWGKSSWPGKPAGLAGASPGAIGTAVAQSQLRSILTVLGIELMAEAQIYLTVKEGLFAEDGSVTDAETAAFLSDYLDRFAGWIERSKR